MSSVARGAPGRLPGALALLLVVAAVTAPETFEQPLPADPLVWHKLALAENGLGDREAARRAFERALWLAVDRGDGAHASEVAGALQKLARAAAGDSARR